jgi:hypothetical protein
VDARFSLAAVNANVSIHCYRIHAIVLLTSPRRRIGGKTVTGNSAIGAADDLDQKRMVLSFGT